MFRVGKNGFQIEMPSGYTVSVQFGSFNYCSNRDKDDADDCYKSLESPNAEVAVMDSAGKFVALSEHDDVKGYQSVSEVIALINKFNRTAIES